MGTLQGASTPWGTVRVGEEFFYQRGRTDVIAVTKEGCVLDFEAKLTRWRDALHQAYRNTCFAHRSYVVLPESTAKLAAQYLSEFQKRSVGLCYITESCEVVVALEASSVTPLLPWLSEQAVAHTGQSVTKANA